MIIKHLTNDLDIFIYKYAIKYNFRLEIFNEWKYFIVKHFKTQSISLKNTRVINSKRPVINHKAVQIFLNNLKNNYGITHIDKAANIFTIICKKIYRLSFSMPK